MKFRKAFHYFIGAIFWCIVASIAALAALVLIYGNDLPDYKNLATSEQ